MTENNQRYRCSTCGKSAHRVQGNYLFRESGLPNVVLKGIEIIRCDQCGKDDPVLPKLSELLKLLASAIVRKPTPLTGAEIRFIRKFLDMNGETFANVLGVDKTTLSKWENDQIQIGSNSDRLIRAVMLCLAPGSKEQIEEGIRHFATIREGRNPVLIEVDARELTFQYA